VYGTAYIVAKPKTVGFGYLTVQLNKLVVEGINEYSSNELAENGIVFPYTVKSGAYMKIRGNACIQFENRYDKECVNFNPGESLHIGGLGKVDVLMPFSQNAKDKHNARLRKDGYNTWEKDGYATAIYIVDEVYGLSKISQA
jgi:hypothetical protein